MSVKKSIEFNVAIFPTIMQVAIGEPYVTDKDIESVSPELMIELPRGANVLYLKRILGANDAETRLLENYVYGVPFSDNDYNQILDYILVPVRRARNNDKLDDILSTFGVRIHNLDNGKREFVLIDTEIPRIKAETWECIIIDHLKIKALEIVECFDFNKYFNRKCNNTSGKKELKFSFGSWAFSEDEAEQRLSNSLRIAFIFTLIGYKYGDARYQYGSFNEYFDMEFYKRVSLIYGIWTHKEDKEHMEYIPLYESFHNLKGISKKELIDILKVILDDESIALDEKEVLKNRLIDGTGTFHHNINSTDKALEDNLIKPAINYILLREKAKEAMVSAQLSCDQGQYITCANRCFYVMEFSLKALLENKGMLAGWKKNELKEAETHKTLDKGLADLVVQGVLSSADEAAYEYVKDQRWKCDYSLYRFEKKDAENCLKIAKAFYTKIEAITK